MARVAFAVPQGARAVVEAAALIELSLVPKEEDVANAWSIDQEPMGSSWHDSSWMLRKGLEVIEGVPMEAVPTEWRRRWRAIAAAAPAALALVGWE